MSEHELPPLPLSTHSNPQGYAGDSRYLYTADQMRAYANAALTTKASEQGAPSRRPGTGMQSQMMASQLSRAVFKDESPEEGGCDISAGLYGPHASQVLREWATAMLATPPQQLVEAPAERELTDEQIAVVYRKYRPRTSTTKALCNFVRECVALAATKERHE